MFDIVGAKLDDLLQIISFLIPGFLTIIFFFYLIPAKKKSDLEIIVFSVVTSSILSLIAIGLFSLISYTTNLKLKLVPTGIGFDIARIFVGLILATLLARFFQTQIFRKITYNIFRIRIYPFSRIWNDFFNTSPNSVVKVFMNNGTTYIGVVRSSSVDPNDDVQELELWKPLYFNKNRRRFTAIKEVERVLLNGTSIVSIEMVKPEEAKKIYPIKSS